jgi:hypothetical protein
MSKMKDRVIRDEEHFEEKMASPNVAQAVRRERRAYRLVEVTRSWE